MATPPIVPGDAIRGSLQVLRTQFALLFPLALVFGLLQAMVSYALEDTGADAIAAAVSIVLNTLLMGVVVIAVHEDETGAAPAEPTVGPLLRTVAPLADKLLVVLLLTILGIVGGLFLLIVPGLFLMTIWAVAAPVVVIERVGPIVALRRSRDLVVGNGWPVFTTLLLMILVLLPAAFITVGVMELGSVGGSFAQVLFGAVATLLGGILATVMYHRLAAAEAATPPPAAPDRDGADPLSDAALAARRAEDDRPVDDPDREGGSASPTGDDAPSADGPVRPEARSDADPATVWGGSSRTGGPTDATPDDGASDEPRDAERPPTTP